LVPLQGKFIFTTALEVTLGFSVEHSSAAYDSAYIALEQQLSLPFVTADEALVHRFGDTGLNVRFLGDWPG
jgi:predicted nucleic acid-binding protein